LTLINQANLQIVALIGIQEAYKSTLLRDTLLLVLGNAAGQWKASDAVGLPASNWRFNAYES
jgi:ABC-type phosphate/phosphonate transport system ATPase subunit